MIPKDNRERVNKAMSWRKALMTTVDLCGWDLSETDNRHESECTKQIVWDILSYTRSHQVENMIGTESRIGHVKSLLETIEDAPLVTSSNSSSTAAPTRRWTYDVFISFRGEDTRKNFVDHLYAALDQAGIYTFKDDKKL